MLTRSIIMIHGIGERIGIFGDVLGDGAAGILGVLGLVGTDIMVLGMDITILGMDITILGMVTIILGMIGDGTEAGTTGATARVIEALGEEEALM